MTSWGNTATHQAGKDGPPVDHHLADREKLSTPEGPLPPKTHPLLPGFIHQDHVKPTPAKVTPRGRVNTTETISHAVGRMRTQGYSDTQIRGQVKRWHPNWSEAKILNTIDAAEPVKSSGGSALGKYSPGSGVSASINHAPQTTADLQTLRKAEAASPLARTLGEITNPILAVTDAVSATHKFIQKPGVGTGVGAGLAMAGILPVGRLARIAKAAKEAKALEIANAAHTTEEAAKIREALPGMKVARGKQNVGYAAERKARFARAEKHLQNTALPPDERVRLARSELAGELPKIHYKGFDELTPDALAQMRNDIHSHPLLSTANKINADKALTDALAGKVPQPHQIALLEHVFGKDTAAGLSKIASHPFRETVLSALNIPRSLMASLDLSAPFRQGLVVATRHPSIFFKNFVPMVKSFGSEKVYNAVHDEIQARPSYPLMLQAKLAITRLDHAVGSREEQFGSDLAERFTDPLAAFRKSGAREVGRTSPVRMSGRAYTAFLDKTRADLFDHLIERAQTQTKIDRLLGPLGSKQVPDIHDEKFLKDLGRYINAATGRGNLSGEHLQGAAKLLNALFFSPRLLASRVDLIFSPVTYLRADPFVRRQAIRSMIHLAGTASTLLAIASQIPGVKVVADPRNPDWGKIKKGNTRIDIGGGFQQPLRLFAQVATGEAISSTSGKKLNLTSTGFGQPTRLDLIMRFFEGKESPLLSVGTDWLRNSNQVGQKFTWGSEAYSHMIPLLAQDVADVYNSEHGGAKGIGAAAGGAAIGALGFGLQTYGPKQPKSGYASGSAAIDQAVKDGRISPQTAQRMKATLAKAYQKTSSQSGAAAGTWGH